MSARPKKYRITSETHEIVSVRRSSRQRVEGFCSQCAADVEMITIDMAVDMTRRSGKKIIELVNDGSVHSIETDRGHLLLCERSLTNRAGAATEVIEGDLT